MIRSMVNTVSSKFLKVNAGKQPWPQSKRSSCMQYTQQVIVRLGVQNRVHSGANKKS